MKENMKKSKKEKGVLIGALGIAAFIVAGSTFSWFTSQDEVTNRLTASADYGVSITETFTPPEDWTPGQTVNKDVSAVNTGNISAFVKLQLEGAFNLTVETLEGEATDSNITYDADTETATTANSHTLDILKADEVTSIQAGGYLYSAPANVTTGNVGSDFKAETDGLYLFRRAVESTETGTTYDYAGYFKSGEQYYGLKTVGNTIDVLQDKGETLTAAEIAGIKLKSYEQKNVSTSDAQITWDYSKVNSENLVTVTYHPTGVDAADTTKDIKINIALANIGDGSEADTWQYVNKAFYYTDDVEPAETTNKLVDSVTLDADVNQTAFSTMDFDLTIKLESVQVTMSDDGTETEEAANTIGTVKGAPTVSNKEITIIGWQ